MRSYIAAWIALRRLGFEPGELRPVVSRTIAHATNWACFLEVRAQGKTFVLQVGDMPPTEVERFADDFRALGQDVYAHGKTFLDLEDLVADRRSVKEDAVLREALRAKGFRLQRNLC